MKLGMCARMHSPLFKGNHGMVFWDNGISINMLILLLWTYIINNKNILKIILKIIKIILKIIKIILKIIKIKIIILKNMPSLSLY